MDAELDGYVDQAKQNLLDAYEQVLKAGNEEQQNPDLFIKLLGDLCKIKHEAKTSSSARAAAQEKDSVDEFNATYEEECRKAATKTFSANRLREFKEFTASMHQMADGMRLTTDNGTKPGDGPVRANSSAMDCDDIVMESTVNVIDPLTKRRMVHPLRNSRCGHNYEKSAILEAIALNGRLRCPVAGCGNKHPVLPAHLEDNYELKTQIEQMPPEENND